MSLFELNLVAVLRYYFDNLYILSTKLYMLLLKIFTHELKQPGIFVMRTNEYYRVSSILKSLIPNIRYLFNPIL